MPRGLDLERLYDEHAQSLYAYLLNFTRHEADTRDLLQDLFIKLAANPACLDSVQNERHFLLRLAHNAAIDLMRHHSSREHTREQFAAQPASPFAPAPDPDEPLFQQKLSAALGDLPPDQRAVVHLKLWQELTFEEIAVVLDISPNTAASRYRYGLDKLRGHLRLLYDEMKSAGN